MLPHISVQLAETWIAPLPCWWSSCCCPTCVVGLLMGPVCQAAMCLSLWHSLHLTTAVQSLARWLVEAKQQKQFLCWVSKAFRSARDLDVKMPHFAIAWHSLWIMHHLAGSLQAESSVLTAVSPCPMVRPLAGSAGSTEGGLTDSP